MPAGVAAEQKTIPDAEVRVAVIDVGFNSLKMMKYIVEVGGSIRSYGQLGVMARLGEGLDQTGLLGKEPVSRTLNALRLCRETASLESIKHLLLVGTSPVREAANRDEFLRKVKEETGMDMRVLTEREEALYGFLGAAKSVGAPTALFFDLGGGSLQLTYAEGFRIKKILSLRLGALKLTSSFAGEDGLFSRKERQRLAEHVSRSLPSRLELGLKKDSVLVGTGGTVRALARFDQELSNYQFNKIHCYSVGLESVQEMSRDFSRLNISELGKIDAIGEDRAQTIVAGALVVRTLMKKLGFKRLTVSTHGLRDGVLTDFLERTVRPAQEEFRKEDVERLLRPRMALRRQGGNPELAECLARNGFLDQRQRRLLMAAVEKGRDQECRDADADALFGILMSEDLPLDLQDQLFMVISLVRAKRPRTANWLLERYGSLLRGDDFKSVRKMGACLRLMEILDRSSARFRVSYSAGVRILVTESDGPFPLELARTSALALSTAIKTQVSVLVAGLHGRERRASLARAVNRSGKD